MRVLKRLFRLGAIRVSFIATLAVTLIACSSTRQDHAMDARVQGMAAAHAPAFLTGPISVLLTNAADYQARVTLVQSNSLAEPQVGNLFQQEGWLLFVPVANAPQSDRWAGRFRFLSDTRSGRVFVMSEALRGFAELRAPAEQGSIVEETLPGALGTERLGEQNCLLQNVRVGESRFRLWRTADRPGPPAQIAALDDPAALVVQLAQVEVERLSPDLFTVPARFARYEDIDSMVRELTRKIHVLPYSTRSQWRPSYTSWPTRSYPRRR